MPYFIKCLRDIGCHYLGFPMNFERFLPTVIDKIVLEDRQWTSDIDGRFAFFVSLHFSKRSRSELIIRISIILLRTDIIEMVEIFRH